MMNPVYNTNISYLCPVCADNTVSRFTVFDIPDEHTLGFVCHNNCSDNCVLIKKSRKRYVITVECAECDRPHVYVLPVPKLWSKSLKTLRCPSTGAELVYIGSMPDIRFAMSQKR